MWEGGSGGWALRALMDLVEGGDVHRLFSDAELLKLVAAEEEHERRPMTGTHKPGGPGNAKISRDGAESKTTANSSRMFPAQEELGLGETGRGRPGSPTACKDEVC